MLRMLIAEMVRPYIRAELPGWGIVYAKIIGDHRSNARWSNAAPRIIRDKRNGYFRILNVREWADRSFYFIGRWYDLEAALAIKAVLRPGDRVLDVGANYGHFTLEAAAAIGPGGRLIAVEPNPVAFARLQLHVALNQLHQVETHNIGLSDVPGELVLSIPRINSGEASFSQSAYDDVTRVICPVSTVDQLVGEDSIDFLKIDVEGLEVYALRGSAETLKRYQPIVLTEIVDGHLTRAGVTRTDLFRILCDLHYFPYRLGLRRSGFGHALELTPFLENGPDGDALWIPESRRDRLVGILPSTSTVAAHDAKSM